MKIELFKGLDTLNLQDNESIDLKIQKTGDEYTVLVIPRMAGHKTDLVFSGTSEELDENLIAGIAAPVEKVRGFKSNAETAEVKEDEADDNEKSESSKKETKRAAGRKAAKTKASKDDEKSDQEVDAELTKESIKQKETEVADKKEQERLAKEKLELDKAAAAELLLQAQQAHNDGKWIEKDRLYQKAAALLPDDKQLQTDLIAVQKYTDALIRAEILVPRDQWEKEVTDGVQS